MKRNILVFLVLAALAAPVATAGGPEQLSPTQRIIRQEDRGGQVSTKPAKVAVSPVQRIIAQEDARKNDPALLGSGPVVTPSIEIVQSTGFDWGDAGIGAAVVAAVMLVLAGMVMVLRTARPRRA
jgi:hypothetical protein